MRRVVGIDIGGTNFRIGLADGTGDLLKFRKLPVKSILTSDDVLGDIAAFIEGYAEGEELDAVSIGFPATLNRDRTRVLQAPNLQFMENLPVVEHLSRRLGTRVFAERDVTMALSYDVRKYDVPTQGVIIGIYFGTGIGNAIMIDGHFLTGRNGTAGELGHIPVDGNDELCGCGLRGCIENLAGGKYLAWNYPADEIAGVFENHSEELEGFIARMAACVAVEVNILDPEYVILGGGVLNMRGFPRERLHARILEHVRRPYPAGNLRVIYAEDEPQKSVQGAVYYALGKTKPHTYDRI